jgi:cytoskeletal protein CcmA (bactofilin family)
MATGRGTRAGLNARARALLAGAPVIHRTRVPRRSHAQQARTVRTERPLSPRLARSRAGSAGTRVTVGPDIKLKGAEITDCDTLVVEGRVEASMDARVMQIAESGSFHGTVGVDVAEIRGRFEGEMTARKQLIIHPGGKVTGKIHYGKIVIEEGGELSGDVGTIANMKPAAVLAAPKPAVQAANH